MDNNLLFGSNEEVEILEFKSGGNSYGMRIEDVREILPYQQKPTPVPNANPYIEGIIMPRDFLIPIIDLIKTLNLYDVDVNKKEMLIVTGINELNIAFHVDSVKGIHRVNASEIVQPERKFDSFVNEFVTGILERNRNKIEILDYRKIIHYINPEVNVG